MYRRTKDVADYYWPWALFFSTLDFKQGVGSKGDEVLKNRGGRFSAGPWGAGVIGGD